MTNNTLTVFEYSEKEINAESGFELKPKEILVLEKLRDRMRKIYRCDIISLEYKHNEAYKLRTSSYVGVFQIGNKTIQILPKMSRGAMGNEEYNKQAIKNLLFMLTYTKKLQIRETDIASLHKVSDNFFEVLIFLFAKNLLRLVQNDISKQYVYCEDNLTYIKGKLQFSNHIKHNMAARNRFYLEYDEFCEDNPMNRIFKYVAHFLSKISNNYWNIKLLNQLNFIFNEVTFKKSSLADIDQIILTRLNKGYEPILQLCRIFIGNSSLELNSRNVISFSFVFDMNVLFEEFIGEFIRKSFSAYYEQISLQRPIRYLVEDKIMNENSSGRVFQLKPDIQFFQNSKNPVLIMDTKYKILNDSGDKKEGVAQSDLYQMNAYAKKYLCSQIILLYPRLADQKDRNIKFVIDKDVIVRVGTVDLTHDFKKMKERNKLKNEISRLINL